MTTATLLDTGPLVAFFDRADVWHAWAVEQFARLSPPLLTCEAVLTEACFLLTRARVEPARTMQALMRGALSVDFSVNAQVDPVTRLLTRYRDSDISLADACLVRMSELHSNCQVLTLDRDFLVYRREGRRTIPLIAPF